MATAERPDAPPHVLPDVIRSGLKIVFCGTAAGTVSARRGAYYAHPQNKFWRTLFAVGLTPRLMSAEEYRVLSEFGLGLTDLMKSVSGMDHELPRDALNAEARAALTEKIGVAQPKLLAFTSLAAGRGFLGRAATFGDSGARIGETRIWVLPSPSPAAHWNFDQSWWRRLAEDERALASPA
ncbi:mismatch-specific DNA-glycosylase [Roseiarcus sp.]|uniref:mismatch-specific DNA-glycosylase n=1 Tax=Roseiarcus sp. TaxID=1969460 RepID=UPI003F9CD525